MAQSPNTVAAPSNWRPCVGVLCIDVAAKLQREYGMDIKSYIAASYVKFLESAGAWVVPIWIGRERSYYENIMCHVSGILIPGGAVFLNVQHPTLAYPNDCVESARIILEIASTRNDAGQYFPLWGTCLGMQLLLVHSAGNDKVRRECEFMNCMLPLELAPDVQDSRLFANLSARLQEMLERKPVAYHYHRYCITKQTLQQCQIEADWRVLATNKDADGLEFLSIVEHVKYPFYGVQFHPERACFEQVDEVNVSTDCGLPPCIEATQYFGKFFVNECRKSDNRFATHAEQMRHLIERFPVTFTADSCPHWLQCYLYGSAPDYPLTLE